MSQKNSYLFILTFLLLILPKNIVKANDSNVCLNDLEASFELEKSWIFICNNNQEKTLIQLSKKEDKKILNIPAFGTFPTYAGLAGEMSDPNSKIYNISPYDFKLIQASIIKNITPVIDAVDTKTGAKVTILSGEKEVEAIAVCQENKPVKVFETETDNIYICIAAQVDDLNSINLNYIQRSKTNPENLINLPANLTSTFGYETPANQDRKYSINYQGLEVYENQEKVMTKPVTNLYLALPEAIEE